MKNDREESGYFDEFDINKHFHPSAVAVQSKI
jgi:hypothetical protein